MKKLKVQVLTLGCSKNTVDTEHILAALPDDRFEILSEEFVPEYVDYLLVNTCGFIGDAKEESIQAVLECVRRKDEGKVGKLAVFGCLSQRYGNELSAEIPEVDAWLGARDLDEVSCYIHPQARTCHKRHFSSGSYAYLKISEGCDRRCSYCAIPHIRGAHRSVPMEILLDEARFLAGKGVKELILIAQDTTFYGLDLYGKRCLAELLQKLSEIQGIEWLRIHYSYPADFPEDVLEQMANNPKVCKYLDIPLQHISDNVLDNMHRHVNGEWTRNLIERLRSTVPGVALRTTMIVGHPGESEADFNELLDFIKQARFERLGAFKYSEEEGTWGAAKLRDDVSPEIKESRYEALMEAQSEISLAYNESRIGTVERVLVDTVFDGRMICRSQYESPEVDGEISVPIKEGVRTGDFINVRITDADYYDLTGEILE